MRGVIDPKKQVNGIKKKKRNDYFKKLTRIIKQYPGFKNKNDVTKKWIIQLQDHIEDANDKGLIFFCGRISFNFKF